MLRESYAEIQRYSHEFFEKESNFCTPLLKHEKFSALGKKIKTFQRSE